MRSSRTEAVSSHTTGAIQVQRQLRDRAEQFLNKNANLSRVGSTAKLTIENLKNHQLTNKSSSNDVLESYVLQNARICLGRTSLRSGRSTGVFSKEITTSLSESCGEPRSEHPRLNTYGCSSESAPAFELGEMKQSALDGTAHNKSCGISRPLGHLAGQDSSQVAEQYTVNRIPITDAQGSAAMMDSGARSSCNSKRKAPPVNTYDSFGKRTNSGSVFEPSCKLGNLRNQRSLSEYSRTHEEVEAMSDEECTPSESQSEVKVIAKEVRIGNFLLKDRTVIFGPNRLTAIVRPVNSNSERVILNFRYGDIIRVIWALTAETPGALFNLSPQCGVQTRKLLRMDEESKLKMNDDTHHPYFDPASANEKKRRVIIIFDSGLSQLEQDKICSFYGSSKSSLKKEFSEKMLAMTKPDCLEYETPLRGTTVRGHSGPPLTSSAEINHDQTLARSTDESARYRESHNLQNRNDVDSKALGIHKPATTNDSGVHLCQYPFGEIGSIELKLLDLQTLDADSFLNDNVIEFYMKFLQREILPEEIAEKTFIFNTFFYKSLINCPVKGNISHDKKVTLSKKRHQNVKRWTKKVDLFSKDFIVIPICQNAHWFLVIICYPWLVLKSKGILDDHVREFGEENCRDSLHAGSLQGEPRDNCDEELENSPKTHPERAAIYVFDSLRGSVPCGKVYSTLRDYLTEECFDKKARVCPFDFSTMRGFYPSCPQQTNLHDCGIFLLEYAKKFLSDPPPINRISNCQVYRTMFDPDYVMREKRREISEIILDLHEAQHPESDVRAELKRCRKIDPSPSSLNQTIGSQD